jgi:hypothetical protein
MTEPTSPPNGAVPPRLSLKKPGQPLTVPPPAAPAAAPAPAPSPKSQTARIPLPAGLAEALPGSPKKKTARISLDAAVAEPGAKPALATSGVGVSKTIRLAPAPVAPSQTPAPASISKTISNIVTSPEAKLITSRIPLEQVMAAGESAGPKTIRIRRPGATLSGPIITTTPEPLTEPAPPESVPEPSKSQTARVELQPDLASDIQQTQRKTIKIRRAGGEGAPTIRAAPRSLSVTRAAGLDEAAAGLTPEAGVPPTPRWHVVFPVAAAAALCVLCFMIYVLAAQAFPQLGWHVGG